MPNETGRKWVKFEFRGEPGVDVFVAGSFNDWNPTQIRMKDKDGDGVYRASLLMAHGRHEYKFMVNGVWCADPTCTEWTQNEHGTLNSVTTVA